MNGFIEVLKAIWEGFVMLVTSTIPEEIIASLAAFEEICVELVRDILELFIN